MQCSRDTGKALLDLCRLFACKSPCEAERLTFGSSQKKRLIVEL